MNQERPARLRVGLIGAGRAGCVIAAALARAGHQVVAVNAISQQSQKRSSALIPQARFADPIDVSAEADLLLLAVPDDVLADLVSGLVASDAIRTGQIVVHLSGRYGTDVLGPAQRIGALCVAMHPVMTFTGAAFEVERLDGCPFGISASDEHHAVAQALVLEMGGEPQFIEPNSRALYHAALAHASNHLVTVIAQAEDLLTQAGIDSPGQFLAPLVSASLDNVLRSGDAALTGPVSRGDVETLGIHLTALQESIESASDRATFDAYEVLARATAIRTLASHRLTAAQVDPMLDLFDGEHPKAKDQG